MHSRPNDLPLLSGFHAGGRHLCVLGFIGHRRRLGMPLYGLRFVRRKIQRPFLAAAGQQGEETNEKQRTRHEYLQWI